MKKNLLGLPIEIIIFDTEYTSWEGSMRRGWSGPNEYKEIVQIAGIKVNTENFSELDTFNVMIRPVKNPVLSDFFKNLTHITQEQIEQEGIMLQKAIDQFHAWIGLLPSYSYGIDIDVIEENCNLIGAVFPFSKTKFQNLRILFRNFGIPDDQYTSGTIVEAFGKNITRRPHDALHDARTLLEGLALLNKKIKADKLC